MDIRRKKKESLVLSLLRHQLEKRCKKYSLLRRKYFKVVEENIHLRRENKKLKKLKLQCKDDAIQTYKLKRKGIPTIEILNSELLDLSISSTSTDEVLEVSVSDFV